MFLISNALSNFIDPFGNIDSFSKKLDLTLLTANGDTSHFLVLSSSPSNVSPILSGEYPTDPFLKKTEAQS